MHFSPVIITFSVLLATAAAGVISMHPKFHSPGANTDFYIALTEVDVKINGVPGATFYHGNPALPAQLALPLTGKHPEGSYLLWDDHKPV